MKNLLPYVLCMNVWLTVALPLASPSLYGQTGASENFIREMERRQFDAEQRVRKNELFDDNQASDDGKDETIRENGDHIEQKESNENRFYIRDIIIHNDSLISKKEKRKITAPYLNKKISYNDLTNLVRNLTNLLIDKGYITSRVQIPVGQNLTSGTVEFKILTGYIEDIVPDNDTLSRRMKIFTAFPLFKNKKLNIKDIDYGLEQMNKLSSSNASMKIEPGEKNGFSKIIVRNEPKNRLTVDLGCDNLGEKAIGEMRGRIFIGCDNLLNINDSIYMDFTGSFTDQKTKYIRSYTGFFSLPLGKWNFSVIYSRSEKRQLIAGLNTDFTTSGTDSNSIFNIERKIGQIGNSRFKAKTSLALKDKKNFIEDAKIESSSRKLTIAKAGLNFTTFIAGGYFSSDVIYHRGIALFNAYRDHRNIDDSVPRAQFNKIDINLLWNKQFLLFGKRFAYTFNGAGQYGMETLYSSEKISIGDLNTVRGFKNYSITGDRGFYIRNDFALTDFSFLWKGFKGLKVFAGLDYGYTREKEGKFANYGQGQASVIGYCAGVGYNTQAVSANITYARQTFSPWFISEKENIIYFSATVSLTGIIYLFI